MFLYAFLATRYAIYPFIISLINTIPLQFFHYILHSQVLFLYVSGKIQAVINMETQ